MIVLLILYSLFLSVVFSVAMLALAFAIAETIWWWQERRAYKRWLIKVSLTGIIKRNVQ